MDFLVKEIYCSIKLSPYIFELVLLKTYTYLFIYRCRVYAKIILSACKSCLVVELLIFTLSAVFNEIF